MQFLITLGDPEGISPEILCKFLKNFDFSNTPILVGRFKYLKDYIEDIRYKITKDVDDIKNGVLNIIEPEEESDNSGKESYLFLEKAVEILKITKIKHILTLPVSKSKILDAGYKFIGHTEFFKENFNVKEVVMMFVSKPLVVAVYSTHIPLRKIVDMLDRERIKRKIKLSVEATSKLKKIDKFDVRVGVCGLNPHAGEDGKIGIEEKDIIIPSIEELRGEGYNIEGPFSSDVVFLKALSNKYDVVFSWYHDQGLIPVKIISSYRSVNLTWGLPFVRTSPLHGPAFDIKKRQKATDTSLREAYRVLISL
ncbi:MAG: 4-hydroxythreonine-4-phosphate dehydrogenase [Caldiserica bacterium]|nr:MAG: 4-hydroxythreonine-4-phosphate dehydrogenase [Caldisericota bacterium]